MKLLKFFPIIGLLLFFLLILSVGPQKILSSLLTAKPFFLGVAFLFFLPLVLLQTYKWALLLKYQGINIAYPYLAKVFLISSFYAAITPGKLGTFVRIPYIKGETNHSLFDCSMNVVFDRLFDIFSIFLIAGAGIVFLPFFSGFSQSSLFVIFLMLGAILIFFKKNSIQLLDFFYKNFVPKKFKEGKKIVFSTKLYRLDNIPFLSVLFLSIISQLILFSQAYIISLGFGLNIPFPDFIAIMAISAIVSLIPISVQGIGTRDAFLIYAGSFYSVSSPKIIAFSVSTIIVLYLFVLIFGGYILLMDNFSKN